MSLSDQVTLVEVGPRDGLQNEASAVPVAVRIKLIELLADAGLKAIEAGAFVSRKQVPQMEHSDEVLRGLRRRPQVNYPVLVPNLQGFDAAVAAGASEIAVFTAASETFSRHNSHCTIDESFARFGPVAAAAREQGIRMRGYISCVLGCPFEGAVKPATVTEVAVRLLTIGCYEVSLGDTIGVGTPRQCHDLIDRIRLYAPVQQLAGHFHDTYGMAVANIHASLEAGIRTFDCSVAGLGGCPFAPGATGNVATEDVVYLMQGSGMATGVDLELLIAAGEFICSALGKTGNSRVARALRGRNKRFGVPQRAAPAGSDPPTSRIR